MSDIAAVVTQDQATGRLTIDWALDGPDLQSDDGLYTAVALSLFTDRQAASDDVLPGLDGNRRGWWGDMPSDGGPQDLSGSRLWLLARAKNDPVTSRHAVLYAKECLQWLIDDGVAQSIAVAASWPRFDTLALTVAVTQRDAKGQQVQFEFDFQWAVTFAADSSAMAFAPVAETLGTEDGQTITTEDDQPIALE